MKRKMPHTKNMTRHASDDRFERLVFIMEKCGNDLGSVVKTGILPIDERHDHIRAYDIYETGVIIIKGADNGQIITGFFVTIDMATALYQGKRLPNALYSRILKNKPWIEECSRMYKD